MNSIKVHSHTPHNHQHFVFSTWNESRNAEFPQVLEYRAHWERLGFDVKITPNENIRQDVKKLAEETLQDHLLTIFDSLATTNMQFDFWRYAKLYLEGGIYADVDVEPLAEMTFWQEEAEEKKSVVIFEESPSWMANSTLMHLIRPLVSNYQEYPSYASCIVIAPGPKAPFFLDLLNTVDPEKWFPVKEPRRTLMTVGPGHLTRFAKERNEHDFILASRDRHAKLAYEHNGFGTWKPASTLKFEKYGPCIPVFCVGVVALFVWLARSQRRRGNDVEKHPFLFVSRSKSNLQ